MLTYIIIGITVIISFLCFNNHNLFMKLAFIPYRTIKCKEWYRIVSHGFVHADNASGGQYVYILVLRPIHRKSISIFRIWLR